MTKKEMSASIGQFVLMAAGGLLVFFIGFINVAGYDPAPLFGWPATIIGLIWLAFVFAVFSKEFQEVHRFLFALGELTVGIIVCVVNISSAHNLNAISFYGVLSGGVLACLKGVKDLIG